MTPDRDRGRRTDLPPYHAGTALHVNRVGFVGGAERVCLTIAEALPASGWHPVVACPPGALADEARSKGIDVALVPIDRTQITWDPRRLLRYAGTFSRGRRHIAETALRHRASLIHVHHPVGGVYAAAAARRLGIPLVVHVHDILPARPLYAAALRYSIAAAAAVVACSGAGRDLAVACGASREDVVVVPNGLAPGFPDRADATAPADLGETGTHVGVFAAVEPRKGQDVAVRALAAALRERGDLVLWIVGGETQGGGGTFAADLRRLAAAEGVADRVRFAGYRKDAVAVMKAMDVVVLPSVAMESLPMSLIEAMTLGRPCVASRIGGTPEIVEDGRTGRLVEPGDHEALAAAVLDMLGEAGPAAGALAAADAGRRFSGEAFGRAVADVYARLPGVRAAASAAA